MDDIKKQMIKILGPVKLTDEEIKHTREIIEHYQQIIEDMYSTINTIESSVKLSASAKLELLNLLGDEDGKRDA